MSISTPTQSGVLEYIALNISFGESLISLYWMIFDKIECES